MCVFVRAEDKVLLIHAFSCRTGVFPHNSSANREK